MFLAYKSWGCATDTTSTPSLKLDPSGCLCLWASSSNILAHTHPAFQGPQPHWPASSDPPAYFPCLLSVVASLPHILLLVLSKFLPLPSASSLPAAHTSSQQPIVFCSHFIHPPPLHTVHSFQSSFFPALFPHSLHHVRLAWSLPLHAPFPRFSWQDGFPSGSTQCGSRQTNLTL